MSGYPALGVGLDEAWDRATPDQVKAYGASFLCRYLGEDASGKNLTRAEAEQLSAAGLWIVSNYEYRPGAALKGYAEGVRVAQLADAQHRACGGPPDRPIYFSVDIDITSAAQMAAVLAYFRGIASVIDVARTGAYGEYDVIRTLFDGGLIAYGWQTYAWSGSPTRWDGRAQLRQVANGISVSGHDVDRDENYAADYGQWMIGGAMVGLDATTVTIDGKQHTYGELLTYLAGELLMGGTYDLNGPGSSAAGKLRQLATQVATMQAPVVTLTQQQIDAAILKALSDPAIINALGDRIASHIHVN